MKQGETPFIKKKKKNLFASLPVNIGFPPLPSTNLAVFLQQVNLIKKAEAFTAIVSLDDV
jgi:hypothetical protein